MKSTSTIEIIQEIDNLICSQDYNLFIDGKNQNNKLGDEGDQGIAKNMYFEVFRSKKIFVIKKNFIKIFQLEFLIYSRKSTPFYSAKYAILT